MKKIKLEKFCIKKINNVPKHGEIDIDYIDISSIDGDLKRVIGYKTYDISEAPSRAKQLLETGDVLVSTVRPNLNAVGLCDIETDNTLVGSTGFCVLRGNDKVNNKYIYYFCQSKYFVGELMKVATGASYPAVKKSDVLNVMIPDLKTVEQDEIVKTLDSLKGMISYKKEQLRLYDDLIKSRFVEMFGDPVINNKNISNQPMTEVCEIIDGDRGKNYPNQTEFYEKEYCLFLNAKNVTSSGFAFENVMFVTKEKDEALRKGKVKRGDVILTTRGTIGNLAFYTENIPYDNVRINSGMVILRMDKSIVDEEFFINQFRMQLDNIKAKIASGSAQPQLPISTMKNIMILTPDLQKQTKFRKSVRCIKELKDKVQKSLVETQVLFDSLMQEYFE